MTALATLKEVRAFHDEALPELKQRLQESQLMFKALEQETGNAVAYVLFAFGSETAINKRGQRETVFPLAKKAGEVVPESQAWIAWFESWYKIRDEIYELKALKWAVFWGVPNDERKVQFLRAEWDQAAYSDPGSTAATAHWHVDPALGLDYIESEKQVHWLTMKRVHLGMAGWQNKRGLHYWKKPCKSGKDMSFWMIRSLEYLQDQFSLKNRDKYVTEAFAPFQPLSRTPRTPT